MDWNELIRLDLSGEDEELFRSVFTKLKTALVQLAESLSERELPTDKIDFIHDLTRIAQGYVQAKITKPSIENEKLIAQIAGEYAAAQERLANARKANAEADAIETETALKRLRTVLELMNTISQIKVFDDRRESQLIIDATEEKEASRRLPEY